MPKITLTQSNPDAPTFMTICANPISEKEEIYSALIHSFGDISENGEKCQSFGPHFNPYGVKKFREKNILSNFMIKYNVLFLFRHHMDIQQTLANIVEILVI